MSAAIKDPADPAPNAGQNDPTELDNLKAELSKAHLELEVYKKQDVSLNDKVKQGQDDKEKNEANSRSLESALTFNLTSSDFLKANESILPKDIADIFKVAAKETYGSAVERANATKAAIIQSFFSQQSNLEILTPTQQTVLADYLKLTKNGKEDKAKDIFDNLFEPALSTLKRVKKAEELNRSKQGHAANSDSDQAYKEKLTQMAERKLFKGKR